MRLSWFALQDSREDRALGIETPERCKFVFERRVESGEIGNDGKIGTAATPDLGKRVVLSAGSAHHARNPQASVLVALEQTEIRRNGGQPTDLRRGERQHVDKPLFFQWHHDET